MKYSVIFLVTVLFFSACQNNQLTGPVDCSLARIEFTATLVNTDCGQATGSVEIMVTAGEGPFTYSLNGGTVQESALFSGLAAGEYTITVFDKNGCTAENTALVANKNGLEVTVTTTEGDCGVANGALTILATNGVEPYQYQLNDQPVQDTPAFTVAPGTYEIFVTDAIGCEFSLTQRVNSNTSYQADVQPIIMTSCVVFGCHDGSVSNLPNFSNFSEVQANAGEIKSRTQSRNMPRTGSLTQAQIDLIACWVDDGARDN